MESQHSQDLSSKRLNAVVDVEKRPPRTYYRLSPALKECAQKMHSLKDSLIFLRFWEEAAQRAGEECGGSEEEFGSLEEEAEDDDVSMLDLNNVFSCLISPCFVSYEMLYDELRSGSLTLSAVDRIFQEFTNHPEDIKTELNIICKLRPEEDRDWVDQRVQQIQQYHEMHLTFDAAKIIASVKESLNLSGDFSVLEHLLDIVSIPLSSVLSGRWLESLGKSEHSHISPSLSRAMPCPKMPIWDKNEVFKVLLCNLS